ncbi:MAG: molybdate ABC transporter substrate-binding protein [Pseudomonadota bacterium]
MVVRLSVFLLCLAGPLRAEAPLLVFAASSLAGPLNDIAALWDEPVTLSFAGSATLARQVEAGAPADVVILANTAWMDHLVSVDRVAADMPRAVIGNRLVLAGRTVVEDGQLPPDFERAMGELAPTARIATGLTDAVPVGIYARQALQKIGQWDSIRTRLVETENARLALALVARGDVPNALVYRSDVAADPRVGILAEVPPEMHDPIRYVIAPVRGRDHSDAQQFIDFLFTPDARAIFEHAQFVAAP